MLAFRGLTVPAWLTDRLAAAPVAGFTLFRAPNLRSPAQVRRLTTSLQAAARARTLADAREDLPLLIAVDQEGGQLLSLGDGVHALRRPDGDRRDRRRRPRRAGRAGDRARASSRRRQRQLRARSRRRVESGQPGARDPVVRRRPGRGGEARHGLDAGRPVGRRRGDRQALPGHGRGRASTPITSSASSNGRGTSSRPRELRPFRAAIEAGVRTCHVGPFRGPGADRQRGRSRRRSRRRLMHELLRDELGFDGVSITDALDMHAIPQGAAQAVDRRHGARRRRGPPAGDARSPGAAADRDRRSVARPRPGCWTRTRSRASAARSRALRRWLGGFADPPMDVVGSAEHRALARELAARSLTLVRDDAGLLPLRLGPEARILAVMPEPRDLTPADTSSYVPPALADALRAHHPPSTRW